MSRAVNAQLAGKVALISGTARGMGRAAALRFSAEGAIVAGGDVLQDEAQETLALIEGSGAVGSTTHLDVTDQRSVQAWVQAAAARFHRIDILYANAGAVRFGPIDEQPLADWRLTLAAELDSVFLTAQAAWPYLKAHGGVIITVGSTAGILGSTSNQRAAHTASKGGVIALTRQLAAEGAPHGIRAVCISPGMISTEGSRDNLLAPDHPMRTIADAIPLRRLGTPEDVVAAAGARPPPHAGYITGTNLVIDGGWSAVLPS
jgi:meso-butanediol dehydrogenase/(S,S)-butanediol dehydrogenase/diacetyl reductase